MNERYGVCGGKDEEDYAEGDESAEAAEEGAGERIGGDDFQRNVDKGNLRKYWKWRGFLVEIGFEISENLRRARYWISNRWRKEKTSFDL